MNRFTAFLEAWGMPGTVILALLDSAGIPLPAGVDILLLLTAAATPEKAYLSAALSVAGSVIGCFFLYWLARKGGTRYLEQHTQSRRATRFRKWFGVYGLTTVFVPALVPILPLPLKVFVLSAGAFGVTPRSFVLTILAARIPRYFALAALGRAMGRESLPILNAHKWELAIAAVLIATAMLLLLRPRQAPAPL